MQLARPSLGALPVVRKVGMDCLELAMEQYMVLHESI